MSPGDLVLDVGAGTGALTAHLLASGAHVVAVELHDGRAQVLRRRFGKQITVVRVDIARLRLPRRPFRVVASPPYAASSALLTLLMSTDRLQSADLVLQRAAARRFVLSPPAGRYSRHYQFHVGILVPRRAFDPPPQVDAAVLEVRRRRYGLAISARTPSRRTDRPESSFANKPTAAAARTFASVVGPSSVTLRVRVSKGA